MIAEHDFTREYFNMERKKNNSKKNAKKGKKGTSYKKASSGTNRSDRLSAQQYSEIWGIVWITLGLLLGLAMYVIARSSLGAAISSFIRGMVGIIGYFVPPLFIYIGVMCFLRSKVTVEPVVHIMTGVFAYLILMLMDINLLDSTAAYGSYLSGAYTLATAQVFQGGMLAAILTYPLIKLTTAVGANIIVLAAMLITLIITFRFSIADIVAAIHRRHLENKAQREAEKEEKRRMIEEEYSYDESDYTGDYDDEHVEVPENDKDGNNSTYDTDDYEMSDTDDFLSFLDRKVKDKVKQTSISGEIVNEPEEDDYIQPDDDGLSDDTGLLHTEYRRPPLTLLNKGSAQVISGRDDAERQGRALIAALANFGIEINISHISIGPAITRFEIQLAKGVRIRSITSLDKDIALALAAESVRIEAPIPGKQAVGVEIPNKQPTYVYLRDLLESQDFSESQSVLTVAVGKDIIGKDVITDISKMPHLMIAGSTGSGKSVCMNTVILSLVYKASPEEVRLILIDPKIVEFGIYANLPHLLIPVVTDVKKAASALKWSVGEMTRRYSLFAKHKLRNISEYNSSLPEDETRMPRIVIVIDELAELMMSAAKEVEEYITRIAQLGRACGIHLIVATQRPSVDIITGKIKANIVSRIAFAVSDATNSKVILDTTGAECLIGNGDMLFHPLGMAKPRRVQGAFVSSGEVEAVLNFFEEQGMLPIFDDFVDSQIAAGVTADTEPDEEMEMDTAFVDAARLVIETQRASISYIQQRLRLGYNRAARIMNAMENYGIVSTIDPVKKERKVTMSMAEFEGRFVNNNDASADETDAM